MDLSRWQVFDESRDFINDARLAYTWGSGKGGYLVTSNDDVYCMGEHKYGKSGTSLLRPIKLAALCGKGVQSFHHGNFSTLAVTNSGTLYHWNICLRTLPTIVTGIVPENVRIIQVAAGLDHILALTSEGKVFSWGGNAYGQLGIGSTVECHQPQPVNLNEKIVSVACSAYASFALTDEGDVLCWGRGRQNGRSNRDLHAPVNLLRSKSVSKIVGGQYQCLGLTVDGKLYCWGMEEGYKMIPREIYEEISPIVDIAGSVHNGLFVCRTALQQIFVWGKWFGQIQNSPALQTRYKSMDEAFACFRNPTMWRTVTVQPSSYSSLSNSFESALNDEETSDVEFIVDGKKIFAHRIFLKIRVPYFRTMLENNWKEGNQRVIEVEKFTYDVFSAFIKYVYTEKVEVTTFGDLYGLLEAADYYNVQELSEKCENILKMGMNEGNVCKIYALAVRHNAKNLQSYTREYIIPRLSKVVEGKGFWEMDHLLSKQLITELTHKRKLVDASDNCSVPKIARSDGSNNNQHEGQGQQDPGEGHQFDDSDEDEEAPDHEDEEASDHEDEEASDHEDEEASDDENEEAPDDENVVGNSDASEGSEDEG